MRIIGGKLKGRQFNAPANLPVRPTTDMAKEALFNILYNTYDFDECDVLDLFSGTGSICMEFASRGIRHVTAIDNHPGCVAWIKAVANQFDLPQIKPQKADTFKFLAQDTKQYQIIFADPPYDLPNIPMIPQLVMKNNLLTENGTLIVEHPPFLKLNQLPGFTEVRKYGNSSFSFFEKVEV
jgi:16S rRNA (guanine(966)-N(2))-methyltransferase RsmD